jgi:ABC-type lipoprotein export system ATPase subunit
VHRLLGEADGAGAVRFFLRAFELAPGEAVALVGPSGCGKSTLLNILAGLLRPDSGTVRVCGTDLMAARPAALDAFRGTCIGFVHQTFNLLEPFTALENVLLGMRFGRAIPQAERAPRAHALLERVGLSHRLHVRPARLSVGERQRVAIARALANRPRLLLADEPTAALDPRTAGAVAEMLMETCAAEGAALALVTHDTALAAKFPRQFDCRALVTSSSLEETKA